MHKKWLKQNKKDHENGKEYKKIGNFIRNKKGINCNNKEGKIHL